MLAQGLATYAASQGIGVLNENLFIRQMPAKPDNAICVYDQSGIVTSEMHSMDADSFGTRWVIRGSYSWAKAKTLQVHRLIAGVHGAFDGIHLLDTHIQSSPAFVENDEEGRAVYSINYIHDCSIGANIHRTPI